MVCSFISVFSSLKFDYPSILYSPFVWHWPNISQIITEVHCAAQKQLSRWTTHTPPTCQSNAPPICRIHYLSRHPLKHCNSPCTTMRKTCWMHSTCSLLISHLTGRMRVPHVHHQNERFCSSQVLILVGWKLPLTMQWTWSCMTDISWEFLNPWTQHTSCLWLLCAVRWSHLSWVERGHMGWADETEVTKWLCDDCERLPPHPHKNLLVVHGHKPIKLISCGWSWAGVYSYTDQDNAIGFMMQNTSEMEE